MKVPRGKYEVILGKTKRRAATQPEALALVFEYCAMLKPDVKVELAKIKNPKVRVIAQNWRDLNPDRPDLAEKNTKVFGDWWIYNTRSGDKVLALMNHACNLAECKFLEDVWVDCAAFNKPEYVVKKMIRIEDLL